MADSPMWELGRRMHAMTWRFYKIVRRIKGFPHPPPGRYYMADSGYMEQQGYMTPFRDTRYHKTHFRGVDVRTLDRQEKINYIHSKLRNVIERRFGHLKERWHILEGVPFFRREKQAWVIIYFFCNGQLFVVA